MDFSKESGNIEGQKQHYLQTIPTFNDLLRLVEGCAVLPKEFAENKKLLTRLWVHQVLRNFGDRLNCGSQQEQLFENIRSCVKNCFKENFESSFEHLGKIDGQVWVKKKYGKCFPATTTKFAEKLI